MRRDPVPAYYRIYQVLSERIATRVYRLGSQLPTDAELMAEFGVSRHTAAEHRDHDDGQKDLRDRLVTIGKAHDDLLGAPTDIARDQSQRRAEGECHQHRHQANGDGEPRAVDQARQQIAAEIVGAQWVGPASLCFPDRRAQPQHQVLRIGIVRREQGREEREHAHAQHQHDADLDLQSRAEPFHFITAAGCADRWRPAPDRPAGWRSRW